MTATITRDAAEVVADLRALGFELGPGSPGRIRYVYVGDGDPPRAAGPLLEALRARKAEALELLEANAPEWNDDREWVRLLKAYDAADVEAARANTWADAWTWCRRSRSDMAEAVNAALDALDRAVLNRDVKAHREACRAFVEAVGAVSEAYRAARGER